MKLLAKLSGYDPYSRSVSVIASTSNFVDGSIEENGVFVPVKEALSGFDLSRFAKNPQILWAHDQTQLPVGLASEIEQTEDGLKMRISLASEKANPLTEQIGAALREELIRAVSVGFMPGPIVKDETIDGVRHITRANNELLEVSFVPVPADEDAGTAAINPAAGDPEEEQRKRVSSAASELAKARARVQAAKAAAARTDAGEGETVLRYDGSRLGKAERTQVGGARIQARLSRTGILVYRNADGSTRRELRLPEEVFKADSLATLTDAPVIDIRDHTGLVTPETWKKAALGHAREARRDGDFVEGELVVQDKETLDAIDRGDRTELSCGYSCRIDKTSGEYKGEPYDVVQRDIRYNHVALCPPNRGRAGPEVRLRLDSDNNPASPWGVAHLDQGDTDMKTIRLDGKDYEIGSEAHLAKLDEMNKAAVAEVQAKLDAKAADAATAATAKLAAEKARDEAQGRADGYKAELDKVRADADEEKKKADEEEAEEERKRTKRVSNAFRTLVRAFGVRGVRFSEDDEKKMDAMLAGENPERELMLDAIKVRVPTFDAKDKSDDYVRSRFDAVIESVRTDASIHGFTRTVIEEQTRTDADDGSDDPVTIAKKKRDAWAAGAHNTAR